MRAQVLLTCVQEHTHPLPHTASRTMYTTPPHNTTPNQTTHTLTHLPTHPHTMYTTQPHNTKPNQTTHTHICPPTHTQCTQPCHTTPHQTKPLTHMSCTQPHHTTSNQTKPLTHLHIHPSTPAHTMYTIPPHTTLNQTRHTLTRPPTHPSPLIPCTQTHHMTRHQTKPVTHLYIHSPPHTLSLCKLAPALCHCLVMLTSPSFVTCNL